ncbi:MAG: AAA family ATPase [Candidatus Obscuribacterales bacterium]|nr:AAA family ATPase [Candidatus Obscuribacterales bacterium]
MMQNVSSPWSSPLCPSPPLWHFDWAEAFADFDWVKPMIDCPQDPVFHAEGDVATHVRLVCEKLISMDEWRGLNETERNIVFLAAALHDVAKPECTVIDSQGRISSAGHGQRGAQLVRRILWQGDGFAKSPPPLFVREAVSALVRFSSLAFWFWDKGDPERAVIQTSQCARLDLLAILAEADAGGRQCRDIGDLLSKIEFFREYAKEKSCFSGPYPFASEHSRFLYFHRSSSIAQDPGRHAYDDTRFQVTVMSGLPAAGKDHWIKENAGALPVISLDEIRLKLGIEAEQDQSRVLKSARETARSLMRQNQSFVWNATNVTRYMRDPLIRFFRDYGARIRIVYVEPLRYEELLKRNASRPNPLPSRIIEKLADKLEVPDLTEAHELVYVIN